MMRSLSSAVAGMRAMQTGMDVIGNNIANVNTPGFKRSQTIYSDSFYNMLKSGSATVDPSQVGYGANVGSVTKDMSSTGATETDDPSNLYLDGDGFFVVNSKSDGTGTDYYTRLGNFGWSADGHLVDEGTGDYVRGVTITAGAGTLTNSILVDFTGDTTITDGAGVGAKTCTLAESVKLSNMKINSDGTITATYDNSDAKGAGSAATITGKLCDAAGKPLRIAMADFQNSAGLSEVGSSYYQATDASGTASITAPENGNETHVKTGYLEASNVDITNEFTNMITTQRGFQACSRVTTVSDSMLEEIVNLKRS